MFWFNSYLSSDVESYKSLNFVGVPNAFALMLLVWIAIFTMNNDEARSSLQMSLVSMVTDDDDPRGFIAQNGIVVDEF